MSSYDVSAGGVAGLRLLQLDGPIPDGGSGLPPADLLDELRQVQGNILQPHARRFALHVILRFTAANPARDWITSMAGQITTAADERTARQPDSDAARPVFVSLALSARGLSGGRYTSNDDAEQVFRQGMAGRRAILSDPPLNEWDSPYREGCDALLIIADDNPDNAWSTFRKLFSNDPISGVAVVGVEVGQRMMNEFGQDIEHFRYVDGTSQPQFFQADVDKVERRNRRHDWSPGFPPRQVLVRGTSGGYGSYLVFRKLEQNLAAFALAKQRVAAQLGVLGDTELAGATIVGRYEDGRPVGLRDQLPSVLPVENGFVYNDDPPACPIGSHVRIVNPRATRYRPMMIAAARHPVWPGGRSGELGVARDAPVNGGRPAVHGVHGRPRRPVRGHTDRRQRIGNRPAGSAHRPGRPLGQYLRPIVQLDRARASAGRGVLLRAITGRPRPGGTRRHAGVGRE